MFPGRQLLFLAMLLLGRRQVSAMSLLQATSHRLQAPPAEPLAHADAELSPGAAVRDMIIILKASKRSAEVALRCTRDAVASRGPAMAPFASGGCAWMCVTVLTGPPCPARPHRTAPQTPAHLAQLRTWCQATGAAPQTEGNVSSAVNGGRPEDCWALRGGCRRFFASTVLGAAGQFARRQLDAARACLKDGLDYVEHDGQVCVRSRRGADSTLAAGACSEAAPLGGAKRDRRPGRGRQGTVRLRRRAGVQGRARRRRAVQELVGRRPHGRHGSSPSSDGTG